MVINKKRVAIFISGKGSNALNLMDFFKNHPIIQIHLIFSTRENELVSNVCSDSKVDYHQIDHIQANWDKIALEICDKNKIDLIVLAGFLKKVSPEIIRSYPNKIINIHPSLLPKFGGKGMYGNHVHLAVIQAKESISGITIHYVNEEFDKGEIIAQFKVQLDNDETAETLSVKIHALEMKFLPRVVENLLS
jgi:phosphoribosylglycinamide formyltransferase-1